MKNVHSLFFIDGLRLRLRLANWLQACKSTFISEIKMIWNLIFKLIFPAFLGAFLVVLGLICGPFYHLEFFLVLQYINNSLALGRPLQYFVSAQINVRLHRSLLHTPGLRPQARLPRGVGSSPVWVLLALLQYLSVRALSEEDEEVTSLVGSSSGLSWLEGVILTAGWSWLRPHGAMAWLEVWPNIGEK